MNPYYYNDIFDMPIANQKVLMGLAVIVLGLLAVILIAALVCWIIRSMSLHAIAKRRGIENAWLAWIPIGSEWVLGSLSDQYQRMSQRKVTSRRNIMLLLAMTVLALALFEGIISGFGAFSGRAEESLVMSLLSLVLSLGITAASITEAVFYHICNYDLYRSCDPKNAVVFLVLGILLPVTEPFFYLACRKKDLGMISPETATGAPAPRQLNGPEF